MSKEGEDRVSRLRISQEEASSISEACCFELQLQISLMSCLVPVQSAGETNCNKGILPTEVHWPSDIKWLYSFDTIMPTAYAGEHT